jgi:hypothetical protein
MMAHIVGKQATELGGFNGKMDVHDLQVMGNFANLVFAQKGQMPSPLLLQGYKAGKAQDHIAQGPLVDD